MRQALHIFRKDARYLWPEICLILALVGVFGWSNPDAIELLVFTATAYLIARLVHAEALPGDRQFWITRPYRWQSLLGAKLLFVLAFVNLPIMLAQWWVVAVRKFPIGHYFPDLLASQLLTIVCVSLPIVALAAITPGIVSFIFSALVMLGTWFTLTFTHVRYVGSILPDSWPSGIGWIRGLFIGLGLAAMVVCILYLQYRRRSTLLSRSIALAGVALLIAAAWYMPWTAGWELQARLSKQPVDGSTVQVSADPQAVSFQPVQARSWANVDVHIPIVTGAVPDGVHLETDAIAITFQGADGAVWKSEIGSVRRRTNKTGAMLDVNSKLSSQFFYQHLGRTVTIHGALYMTLFANPRQQTIALGATPVNALDGLQCYLDTFDQLACRSAFRWPGKLIFGKFDSEMSPLRMLVSYDPFPGSLGLNPIETGWAPSTPRTGKDVTIVAMEPVAHIRRDFEMRNVPVVAHHGRPPWR